MGCKTGDTFLLSFNDADKPPSNSKNLLVQNLDFDGGLWKIFLHIKLSLDTNVATLVLEKKWHLLPTKAVAANVEIIQLT